MDVFLLATGLIISLILFASSNRIGGRQIRSGIFHPFTLMGLLTLIYQLDFYNLAQARYSFVADQDASLSNGAIYVANTEFLIANMLALVLVLIVKSNSGRAVTPATGWCKPTTHREIVSAIAFWVVALIAWFGFFAIIASKLGTFNFLEFTTKRFLFFADSKILHYLAFWIPPAFAVVAMTLRPRSRVLLALLLVSVVAMFLTGSRDRVLWVLVAYGISILRFYHIDKKYLVAIVPALIVFLYSYLALFRPHMEYDVSSIFLPSKMYEYLVTSVEVSVPDNLASIEQGIEPYRLPFQSLVNIFAYPIPRDWLGGLKTYGAAVDFTLEVRPEAWLLGRSATTIGGFGELRLEFGLFYPLMAGLYMAFMVLLMDRLSRGATYLHGALYVFLYWIFFHFYRTGLSELGNFIWLSVVTYFFNKVFVRVRLDASARNTSGYGSP